VGRIIMRSAALYILDCESISGLATKTVGKILKPAGLDVKRRTETVSVGRGFSVIAIFTNYASQGSAFEKCFLPGIQL
jgi:hypothetical protein